MNYYVSVGLEGIALGEETTKQSLARQMLADGESIEKIQKWTGLSAEASSQVYKLVFTTC